MNVKSSKKLPIISCISILSCVVFISLTQADTDPPAPPDDARQALPAATINGKPMTVGYVESTISKQSPMIRKDLMSKDKLSDFLDRLISMELLAEEAKKRGYEKNTEVASVKKNQLASLMHRRINDSVNDDEPDEASLKKYYDEHQEAYHKPEKVRARHILIADKDSAQKLLDEIKSKNVRQHEFRRMAQENSENTETKTRGGDLKYFTKPEDRTKDDLQIDPAIVKAAFEMTKDNEIFPELIKTDKGYHILMRTGHRDKMDISFEDAKERIVILVRRENRKKKIEEEIKKLESQFKVEIFEENLKHVVIDLTKDSETKGRAPMTKKPGPPALSH